LNFNIWYCTYMCWLCSRFAKNRSSWSWRRTPFRGSSVTRRSSKGCELWHLGSRLSRIDSILLPPRYTFFSRSPHAKNFWVKCALPEAIFRMGDWPGSFLGKLLNGHQKKLSFPFGHQNFPISLMAIASNFHSLLAITIRLVS
jgi:hypothetical protein